MKDIIKLDENNLCISANCIYTEQDKTIEYEFKSEERMYFFENIQYFKYDNNKIVELTKEEKETLFPPVKPQPSEQDLINADIYMQLALLQTENPKVSLYNLSPRYELLKKYYDLGIYDNESLKVFVACGWITNEEYNNLIL